MVFEQIAKNGKEKNALPRQNTHTHTHRGCVWRMWLCVRVFEWKCEWECEGKQLRELETAIYSFRFVAWFYFAYEQIHLVGA